MAVLLSLFCILLAPHISAHSAPSEKTPEAKKRWVGAAQIVQAAKAVKFIQDCRVKSAELEDAFLSLASLPQPKKDNDDGRRPSVILFNCVIYVGDSGTALMDRRLNAKAPIKLPLSIAIKDSRFKQTPFDDTPSVDDLPFEDIISLDWSDLEFEGRLDLSGSVFEERAQFSGSRFRAGLDLTQTVFKRSARFDKTQIDFRLLTYLTSFEADASFSGAQFPSEPTGFIDVKFGARADFSKAKFQGATTFRSAFSDEVTFDDAFFDRRIAFIRSTFPRPVYFRNLQDTRISDHEDHGLWFASATFKDTAFFDGAKVRRLSLKQPPRVGRDGKATSRKGPVYDGLPTVFEKDVSLVAASCDHCDLASSVFRGRTLFARAEVKQVLDLSGSTFSGPLVLARTILPASQSPLDADDGCKPPGGVPRRGVAADGASFEKGIFGQVPLLSTAIRSADADTWNTFAEAFKGLGDHDGELHARYCAQLVKSGTGTPWDVFTDRLSYQFWGYQTKPDRVLLWVFAWWLMFVPIYFTQTAPLGTMSRRVKFAMRFSAERCWKVDLKGTAATTPLFKALTVAQSIGAKVMAILFLKAVTSRFPLLDGVLSKIVSI
ncbi:hypothetical protein LJR084_000545 [Variovorax sp. LjRoot84]|uniref:pentapeptide repeat-containing protein n=1 Tax=Variovorax sp. LjRoot84 TaxID=3342340 RepID=UPI003ECFE506